MIRFIRLHPGVFVQAGTALLLMALSLTVAVLAVGDAMGGRDGGRDGLALRTTSAVGLFAAALFVFGGAVRVGSSGPLLHMTGLRDAWGEAAYVAAQVVSQAVLIGGLLCLCVWAVGLSVIGARARVLPLALCLFAVVPGFRVVGVVLGALGVLGDADILWILAIMSIPGSILWCLGLGLVLLRRSFRSSPETAVEPVLAEA